MSAIIDPARQFFHACETGQGWEACSAFCTEDATFSAQADALAEIRSLEAYCEWMKGLLTPVPDGRYELKFFQANDEGTSVVAVAVFHGTQTGDGGPIPPTGNSISADYVYHMEFSGNRIRHMQKIWNDGHSLKQLGWA